MASAWRLGAGALCAASGLALHLASSHDGAAQCDAAPQQQQPPAAAAAAAAAAAKADAELAALAEWLRQQGADVDAIEFKASETDAGRYGVYGGSTILQRAARGWLGTVAGWAGWGRDAPVAVASFPLDSALTAASLSRHPAQGPVLAELQRLGLADDRAVVVLHLAVERARQRAGGAGPLAPWLALLPGAFGTTQHFSELDLQWLRGTTLHRATRLRQRSLREAWARLEPAARQLAREAGLAAGPTLDDWVWANSVFWSRAIAFPAPDPEDPGSGRVVMQEGVVPGLDFCNHDAASRCKWTVYGAAEAAATGRPRRSATAAAAAEPRDVALVCPRRAVPRPGAELTINYGDKSNEELLFLYGFALEDNPAEVLTLMCPLPPPAEWDAQLRARLALLAARGARPQLHLPAADLARLGGGQAAKAAKAARAGLAGSDAGVLASDLPEGVLETLEVFVMEPAELATALEAADGSGSGGSGSGGSGSGSGGGGAGGGAASELEVAGRRMALLTTLVRLLELKALEMEGREEGTGPLEDDERLLAAAGAQLPPNQRHALLYRMGQKRLARAYLVHAKELLQQAMAHLARLQRDD